MKKMLSVCIAALLVILAALPAGAEAAPQAQETPAGFGAYDHVFIIGVDGAGAAFSKVDSPCFDAIFGNFACRHDAKTEYVTISAQNWGSILTGLSYDTHGFTNSSIGAAERGSDSGNHTIFYYLRQAAPEAKMASFVNWNPINYGLIENDLGVEKYHSNTDPLVTASIEDYFSAGNAPALTFVQLDSVDHAAHAYGGFSEEYYAAVREADALIGRIYNAAAAQGLMENGLFMVVADHVETANGHGGQTPEESAAVLAVIGKNVCNTSFDASVRNRDAAAIKSEADAKAAEIVAEGKAEAAKINAETEKRIAEIYGEAYDENAELFVYLKKLIALENSVSPDTVIIMNAENSAFDILNQQN